MVWRETSLTFLVLPHIAFFCYTNSTEINKFSLSRRFTSNCSRFGFFFKFHDVSMTSAAATLSRLTPGL
uniref:Putative secreted protein n=1 Tax=Anopheles triannulatus TaxID=58253 RepID=A0A2M4B617_9DIPT